MPPPRTSTVAGAATGAIIGAAVSSPYQTGGGALIGAAAGALLGAASDSARVHRRRRLNSASTRPTINVISDSISSP